MFKLLKDIKDDYLVVGVSAGPDSMALLHMLIENGSKKLVCAHVNHNVRKESQEEEEYLRDFCKKNNVIFECMKIEKYHENNFENEARKKRYAFYEEILKKYNSHSLFLAHHGDDLIETVLMKIVRGSNLEGYAGIKTISKQKDYIIHRPLLEFTKEDLIKYNKDNNIKYYIDNTNTDDNYTRNRYRNTIVPLLKKEDNAVHKKFLKYSHTLQDYYNYIEDVVNEKIDKYYKNNTIDIDIFNEEHPFMQRNIIFYLLSATYNNESNIIKDKHIDDILSLIQSNKPNQIISLPKGYFAKKEYNIVSITNKVKNNAEYNIEFNEYLKIDDMIIEKVNHYNTDGNDVCRLNSKDIKLPLYIRCKRDGDIISPLGLNGTKKIKDIFIDAKIPTEVRNNYPILTDSEDKVLWIPNIKKSKYCIKKDGKYDIILISYSEREE
jgi:tRNA(Ile)-lysidine synthetase-like protein